MSTVCKIKTADAAIPQMGDVKPRARARAEKRTIGMLESGETIGVFHEAPDASTRCHIKGPSNFNTLSAELDRCIEHEQATGRTTSAGSDDEMRAAKDRTEDVLDRISAAPATTVSELEVKARAMAWALDNAGDLVGQRLRTAVLADIFGMGASERRAASNDAFLFELCRRLAPVRAKIDALEDKELALEDKAEQLEPVAPSTLLVQARDRDIDLRYGGGLRPEVGTLYSEQHMIGLIKDQFRYQEYTAGKTKDGSRIVKLRAVANPKATRRARSILAAGERHQARIKALRERIGLTEIERKLRIAYAEEEALAKAILQTPARTLAGLRAKAEAEQSFYRDRFKAIEKNVTHAKTPGSMGPGIVRDLLAPGAFPKLMESQPIGLMVHAVEFSRVQEEIEALPATKSPKDDIANNPDYPRLEARRVELLEIACTTRAYGASDLAAKANILQMLAPEMVGSDYREVGRLALSICDDIVTSPNLDGQMVYERVNKPAPAGLPPMDLLEAYSAWLHYERRLLALEMYPDYGIGAEKWVPLDNAGGSWHFRADVGKTWKDLPQPSTRAAEILKLAGVDCEEYARRRAQAEAEAASHEAA